MTINWIDTQEYVRYRQLETRLRQTRWQRLRGFVTAGLVRVLGAGR